jgi:AraC-like DNA-binding protein
VAATDDAGVRARLVGDFLAGLPAAPLPMTATVNAIVHQVARDRSITRVDDLAARLGVGTRRLQRLFADHVGVPPKWVINRSRIHAAAEAAAGPEPVDWATLAADLGYSDQAHLVRDFTAAVGTPPARYARDAASRR